MYRILLELEIGTLELPVLPEKLEVKCAGDNETATVLALGEVSILRGKKLREVSITSVFPANTAPFTIRNLSAPLVCVGAIQAQWDLKKPLRLILKDFDLGINGLFAIEDFTYSESFGAVGEIAYTLDLKEFRAPTACLATLTEDGLNLGEAAREGEPAVGNAYTVVKGDSLWAICKRSYGDGSRYPALYEKNRAVIDGANQGKRVSRYTIYPGQQFTL